MLKTCLCCDILLHGLDMKTELEIKIFPFVLWNGFFFYVNIKKLKPKQIKKWKEMWVIILNCENIKQKSFQSVAMETLEIYVSLFTGFYFTVPPLPLCISFHREKDEEECERHFTKLWSRQISIVCLLQRLSPDVGTNVTLWGAKNYELWSC